MTLRRLIIFAIVLSAFVGAVVWFLSQDPKPPEPPEPNASRTPESQPAAKPPKPGSGTIVPSPVRPATTEPVAPKNPIPVLTEDDRKIDELLRLYPGNSDQDHTNTAQALINLLPTLTKEGQVECVQHISNLLSDDEFKRVMHIWRNPNFNPDVIEVLSTDLMNREHKVMLPAMLDALRIPTHPFHEEAKSTLEIFLDADHGSNFSKWDAAVKEFLRKEAEEAK